MCASNASLVTCYRKLVWLNLHSSVLLFVLAYLTGLTVVMNKTTPELPKTPTASVTSRTAEHNNYHVVSLLRTRTRIHVYTWAFTNFQEWKAWRNTTHPDEPVPANFVDASVDELDKWLARYVAETRNKKGEFYTPSTLHQLLCGLFRHMTIAKPDFPNFIEKILILHSFMEH